MNMIQKNYIILCLCYFSTFFLLGECLQEGDTCQFENQSGVCKKKADCPGGSFNAKARCKKGLPLVICCTGNEKPTQPIICPNHTKEELKIEKDGRGKARDKCIEWLDLIKPCIDVSVSRTPNYIRKDECHHVGAQFVHGGENASVNEFPHQALLGFISSRTGETSWDCGGTLISDQWILTAAHCTFSRFAGNVSKVKINTLTIDGAGKIYDVTKIVLYPEYLGNQKYHDIALLQLNTKVELSTTIVPACLDYIGLNVDKAVVTGNGMTENDTLGMVLQKAELEAFGYDECNSFYNESKKLPDGIDTRSQICFGSKKSIQDSCQGDSGGPLQIKNPDVYCTYTVVGVVSYGVGCGNKGIPAVYSRVSYYIDWIESTVWP